MGLRSSEIYKTTIIGGVINLVLLVFKFVAGVVAGSAAMIADAVHSLSDFATDIIVLAFVRISGKPQDKDHDFGHGKYETLATTCIGAALGAVGLGIIVKGSISIAGCIKGDVIESPGILAFWAAIVSIVLKEATYRYTVYHGRKVDSQAVIANAWHHRSDALSSIGTALGIGAAILLGGRWAVLDPVASVIVGAFIIKVAFDLLKNGIGELMEKSLPDETEEEILGIVMGVPGVSDPHNLRTRRIGNYIAIELHVRMDGDTTLREAHDKSTEIEKKLKENFGDDTHVTVHMEPVK